jgi:hypothetical protein
MVNNFKRLTLTDIQSLHRDDSEHQIIIAHRFVGRAVPGSRIDLCCQLCAERVALCAESVKRIDERGYLVFCRTCQPEIESAINEVLVIEDVLR